MAVCILYEDVMPPMLTTPWILICVHYFSDIKAGGTTSWPCVCVLWTETERVHVGKRCGYTQRKCNYTAVMHFVINDVGLWNQTIAPMANYRHKNKAQREWVSEARAQNVSVCLYIVCVSERGGTSSNDPIKVRLQTSAPSAALQSYPPKITF